MGFDAKTFRRAKD
jgi:hypothetical protein